MLIDKSPITLLRHSDDLKESVSRDSTRRRIVVTGVGLITPLGTDTQKTWKGICEGRSGIGRIKKFDASSFKTRIAGEISDFNAAKYMDPKEARRSDPFIHYAVAATKLALDDAGLKIDEELAPRAGTFISSTVGGLDTLWRSMGELYEKGPGRVSPFSLSSTITNMAAAYVSIFFNAKGPSLCINTACAASTHSIGQAMRTIERGDADVIIAGGTEASVHPAMLIGFGSMHALSIRNDDPEHASRPFDAERDGFVIAEGAGILILEELEFAKRRGANIYAEALGYGMTSDAYHIVTPCTDGPARCMSSALKDARLNPEDVHYINAHGTSTVQNDVNETRAIKEVFDNYAYRIPVSSTKSMTGHFLGAAGGIEAAFTVLSLHNGILPPTINYENVDPECDLDYVPNEARDVPIKIALSNSFAFGGSNASLVLGRFDE
ncbi:MAG: beta-ketoacyl-ACP synthase II [Thermodesulfobacteriota bacterium]